MNFYVENMEYFRRMICQSVFISKQYFKSSRLISSPGRSPGRAIVLPLALA